MAEIDLDLQDTTRAGVTLAFTGSLTEGTVDQYLFLNNERVVLLINNGADAASVDIITTAEIDGIALPDRNVVIAVNSVQGLAIGPFPSDVYNRASRKVELRFTTPTTVEIAVVRLP